MFEKNRLRFSDRERSANNEAWISLIGEYLWPVLATLTFRFPQRDSLRALGMFKRWLHRWHVAAAMPLGLVALDPSASPDVRPPEFAREARSGKYINALRRGRSRPVYVLAVEQHQSGSNHAHALIQPSPLIPQLSLAAGTRLWNEYGLAQLEIPRSQEAVLRYVTKNIPGDAELFFSQSFKRSDRNK